MKIFRWCQDGTRITIERWVWRRWRWEYWCGISFPHWATPSDRLLSEMINRTYQGGYILWKKY